MSIIESPHELGFKFETVYFMSNGFGAVLMEVKRKGKHYVYYFEQVNPS